MNATTARHRLAIYWAAACGGCDIAIINLNEALLDVDAAFEIVFWPAAMDAKLADVEALPDGYIDVTLFNGGIRNSEHEHLARLMRRTSRVLVAFGSCAMEGCIPGLANLSTIDDIFEAVYEGPGTDNPGHLRPQPVWAAPEGELRLPSLLPRLRTLEQVVPVDYAIPGCPPESERIAEVVGTLIAALDGKLPLPPRGAVLGAGHSTVCDECRRDRDVKRMAGFARIQSLEAIDPNLCLLEQGLPCNGPATRDGCGAKCPSVGAPCIGCYGATDGVIDQGARLMSAFASVVDASEPEAIEAILDGLPDPVGQFYRFSLAASLLGGARRTSATEPHGPGDGRAIAEPAPDAAPTAGRTTALAGTSAGSVR